MPTSQPPRKSKKKTAKQTRHHETFVEFQVLGDETGQAVVEFSADGSVTCKTAVEGTFKTITKYKKESGKEKIVFYQGNAAASAALSADRQMLNNFDFIAALDAGTNLIGDVKVTTVCLALSEALKEGDLYFELHRYAILDVPDGTNPEMVAIDIAYHYFIKPRLSWRSKRIGILTDSDLGAHGKINERTIPYLGNSYLPDGFQILYASYDSGDSPANKLIKTCDAKEKALRKELCQRPEDIVPVDGNYPFHRGWILCANGNSMDEREKNTGSV